MHTLFEDDLVRVTARHAVEVRAGGRVLLSFTGIGHQMGGIEVQRAEFFGTGGGFDNTVFITDLTRSWGNRLDFDRLGAILAATIGDAGLYTIGNSMGAFLAIAATRYFPVVATVAFAPQFSVSPTIVPWEHRWMQWRGSIGDWRIPDLRESFLPRTVYNVFSGGTGKDLQHAKLFPVAKNIHHYVFPEAGHNVAAVLKESGALYDIIGKALSGRLDAGQISRHTGAPVRTLSPD